jgi:prolipoprotein diacylglyceryl transferase
VTTLFIPSPSNGVWYLGPVPLRGYALCIIAGIIAAIWIGERRWVGRGGLRGEVTDLALWAVPFGVVGGRIYHVITDHDLYFGDDRSPIQALYVWRGGLGIWGAIALGGVGVWLGARSKGIRVPPVLDAMAPGVLVAQAIGRWGNWFNQELFGKPSTQPWALKIDPENRPPGYEQYATFQPTFLYECLWDLGAFGFVIWADRRFKLGHGRVLALYVMAYTAGRGWIEMLRIDDVEYQHVLGLRLNVWTSIVLFCLAAVYFVVVGRRRPGRETEVYTERRLARNRAAASESAAQSAPETAADPASEAAAAADPAADTDGEPGTAATLASPPVATTKTATATSVSAETASTGKKPATAKKTGTAKKPAGAKKTAAKKTPAEKAASAEETADPKQAGAAKKAAAKPPAATKPAAAKKAPAPRKTAEQAPVEAAPDESAAEETPSAERTGDPAD